MLDNEQKKSKTWHDNWFVKNVLVEIPIVGSFFKIKQCKDALHDAGKCAAIFAGAAAAMMLSMTSADECNNKKKLLFMGFGMAAGKVAYNTVHDGCCLLYQYGNNIRERSRTTSSANSEPHELVSLTAPDSVTTGVHSGKNCTSSH